jgi:hypothetical protein
MFFSEVFVVNFMCLSQSDQVFVFGVFEPFKTLMNQYIVNHKIAKTICGDSAGNEKQIIESTLNAKIKKCNARNSKNDKENIVALKSVFVFWLMVICVKIPHQSMHNVFVREPGDTFHEKKNAQKN